jgi:hypothetical protein
MEASEKPKRGRPPLKKNKAKKHVVAARFTDPEYARIKKAAAGETGISEWARRKLLKAAK